MVANAYRQEGQVGAALPPEVPAPRCHWSAEVDDWVVLGFAHVAGRMPRTPCDQDELDAVLAAWTTAADALAELESRWAAAVVADSAIHCDLRLDNVIIDAAGAAWICDWNWPCLGAAWFDTVQVLLVPYGLGADADAALRRHPTARGVAPEQIDAVLAGFAGAFFDNAVRPPIADCSPYLRAHQRLSGHAALDWLTVRRRWR